MFGGYGKFTSGQREMKWQDRSDMERMWLIIGWTMAIGLLLLLTQLLPDYEVMDGE